MRYEGNDYNIHRITAALNRQADESDPNFDAIQIDLELIDVIRLAEVNATIDLMDLGLIGEDNPTDHSSCISSRVMITVESNIETPEQQTDRSEVETDIDADSLAGTAIFAQGDDDNLSHETDFRETTTAVDARTSTIISEKAKTIREHYGNITRNTMEIGQTLLEVKQLLEYGAFQNWIKIEFDWTIRTANNFMSIASMIRELPVARKEIVSHLPQGTLLIIAAPSTPEVVREAILARAEAGEIVTPAAAKKLATAEKAKCITPTEEAVLTTAAVITPSNEGMGLKVAASVPMPLIALSGMEDRESFRAPPPSALTPAARAEAMAKRLQALPDQALILELADLLSDTLAFNCLRIELRQFAERLREEYREDPEAKLAA